MNSQQKNDLFTIAAIIGWVEDKVSSTTDPDETQLYQQCVTAMETLLNKVMESVDNATLQGIVRQLDNLEISVRTKSIIRDANMRVVSYEDLVDLAQLDVNDCVLCERTEAQAQKCKVHKLFKRLLLEPVHEHHACPYSLF
jgi:hypothetical protein